MGSTERSLDRLVQTVVLADIQRFAALPTWLARAAQPMFVSDMLTRSVPEFAAGEVTLHACKIGGLRLNTASHVWAGTYTLTVTTSATEQRVEVAAAAAALRPSAARRGQSARRTSCSS